MEKQLSQLSPRTRTTDERKKTLKGIQQLVKKEKKKEWLKLASSYAGVAMILFILFATALLPSSTTTSSGKDVKYVGMHTYEINPWYYINAHSFTLNKEGVTIIAELAALADQGAPFELDTVVNLHYEFYIVPYYLGTTTDESESYTLLKPFNETATYYFINNKQNTFTSLSYEEFSSIKSSIDTFSDDYQDFPTFMRIILIACIYVFYLWLSRRLHPEVREPLVGGKYTVNTIGKTVFMFILLYGLTFFLSFLGADYINIITAFIIISFASFARTVLENFDRYDKRNWLEVPLTIFVYTLNLFILFYN